MQTIKENKNHEIIIKNSKFICYLYKIANQKDISPLLDNIKNEYKDATHYCYAYIVDDYKKSSDDGEPSGTAGIPILKVLDNYNLTNVLAIVIRYFGGIKLGASGLIRAYTKSVTNTIDKSNITSLIKGLNINISFDYKDINHIDYLLKDIKINNKSFNDKIIYNLDIEESFLEIIKNNNIKYHIIKNILIEK